MDNELLNDTGGAVPQWVFEVERCEGFILTSHPYAVEAVITSYSIHYTKLYEKTKVWREGSRLFFVGS